MVNIVIFDNKYIFHFFLIKKAIALSKQRNFFFQKKNFKIFFDFKYFKGIFQSFERSYFAQDILNIDKIY